MLFDPGQVDLGDLGTQFLLHESDIGKRRDDATAARLRHLNEYVIVHTIESNELPLDTLKRYQAVVQCDEYFEQEALVNDLTHKLGVPYVSTATNGLFG